MFRKFEWALKGINEVADLTLPTRDQRLLTELHYVTFTDTPQRRKIEQIKDLTDDLELFAEGRLGFMLAERCSDRSMKTNAERWGAECVTHLAHRQNCLNNYLNMCRGGTPFYFGTWHELGDTGPDFVLEPG